MGSKNCEETPRQKMIAMMYLVLTALLALNVSKDILNAFIVVNESMESTNITLSQKVEGNYAMFEKQMAISPEKVRENYDKAMQVKEFSDELVGYIEDIKITVVSKTEGIDFEETKTGYYAYLEGKSEENPISARNLKKMDNYDVPTNYFCGDKHDASNGEGMVLKNKIEEYKNKVLGLLDDKNRAIIEPKFGLETEGEYTDMSGKEVNWVQQNFYHTILVADVVILNKLIADVRNAEADVVGQLYTSVSDEDFKFDQIDAKVVPKSNYVLTGEEFEAEIFVAAYDSKTQPEIVVGSAVDSATNEISGTQVTVEEFKNGVGIYRVQAGATGTQTYGGVITVKTGLGEKKYSFDGEYTVAQPSATVSPTKMNVFYIGVDNPVSISVPGVPTEKVRPSISNGTLSATGGGNYNVRVTGGQTATINVGAEMEGGSRSMGSFEFRVRRVPDPKATISGRTDGKISKNELLAAGAVIPVMENFEFDLHYNIVGYTMYIQTQGSDLASSTSTSPAFSGQMRTLIQNAARGRKVTFEDIRARGPDGSIRKLNPISLTIM
jgi:gliding motility-associated protein GldM